MWVGAVSGQKKWRTPYRSSYRYRRAVREQFYYANEVSNYLNDLNAMHHIEKKKKTNWMNRREIGMATGLLLLLFSSGWTERDLLRQLEEERAFAEAQALEIEIEMNRLENSDDDQNDEKPIRPDAARRNP